MEILLHRLQGLFPADDFGLLLVILGLPLIGALVNGVFGKRLGKEAVTLMALVAVGFSFLASVVAFLMLTEAQHGEHAARFVWHGWEWMTLSGPPVQATVHRAVPIEVAFSIDALSGTMALVVTGVGFLIHLYSTKYMEKDPGYARFFAYLNLFIFSMLVLILGNSLPMLFIGWEGVGLCSYLLIGFWFEDQANAAAGSKAFITNRIGDFGLIVAMAMLLYYVGALDWAGIESGRGALLQKMQIWPLGNRVPWAALIPIESVRVWIETPVQVNVATLVALALFLGCAGKSAQIPLYVWLPDAMAGPTPVSALIHAATMVTAGVYLVCRMAPVFALSPFALFVVAFVGVLTAVFAATIALVQNDIKKVLAYSTVSQLGYMFLGVGVGAFTAGFFHVLTHAFFKACLFLGAGSVIHAMHARIHSTEQSQDMRNMGGLRQYMPYTHWTFLASVLAIAGFPLTAGFFSKDEILFRAWTSHVSAVAMGSDAADAATHSWPTWGPSFLFWGGVLGAALTAFYMGRLYLGIFWGEFRGWKIRKRYQSDPHDHDDHHDEHHQGPLEGPVPHESPLQMTVPLMILGGFALLAGVLSPHQVGVLVPDFHFAPLDQFLEPVFHSAVSFGGQELIPHPHAPELAGAAVAISIGVGLLGLGLAYWMYVMQGGAPARQIAEQASSVHRLLLNKYWIDEIYEETVIGAVDTLADVAVWVDKWIVDGIVAGLTSGVVRFVGTLLRLFQTGRVQAYAAAMVMGLAGLGWFFGRPHATAQAFVDVQKGAYRLVAAPGFGYQYRWIEGEGDEEAQPSGDDDEELFDGAREFTFELERDATKQVSLQVKNAFGFTATRRFEFHRPTDVDEGKAQGLVIEMDGDQPTQVVLPDGTRRPVKPRPAPAHGGER